MSGPVWAPQKFLLSPKVRVHDVVRLIISNDNITLATPVIIKTCHKKDSKSITQCPEKKLSIFNFMDLVDIHKKIREIS